MQDKDAADLRLPRAHRHEDGDVFGLFHHHHGKRNKDVQRGHENDEANGNKCDQALEAQGAKEGFILLHPVRGHEAFPGRSLQLAGDFRGAVDVVDLEFQDRHHIPEAEELLRIGEADEAPGGVVVVEAGVENAGYAKADVFGNHAEGC